MCCTVQAFQATHLAAVKVCGDERQRNAALPPTPGACIQTTVCVRGRRHISLLRSFVAEDGSATLAAAHTILEIYRVADMSLARVLPSAQDEVNAAAFHPFPVRSPRIPLLRRGSHSANQCEILHSCCLPCTCCAGRATGCLCRHVML